jgi:hypothetical protein
MPLHLYTISVKAGIQSPRVITSFMIPGYLFILSYQTFKAREMMSGWFWY